MVDRYDPGRDAQADIAAALAAAPQVKRRVLLLVGGDWCRDCREMDALFASDAGLRSLRDTRYLPVKVFLGTQNRNEAVLARYPKIEWVPTLFELADDGSVLRAVPSTLFHEGNALSARKLAAFLAAAPCRSVECK